MRVTYDPEDARPLRSSGAIRKHSRRQPQFASKHSPGRFTPTMGEEMTRTPTLPNVHDAVMEGVECDWQGATATIRLTLVPGPPSTIALVAIGLRELQVPRDEPWGPSVFVNGAEYVQTDEDD